MLENQLDVEILNELLLNSQMGIAVFSWNQLEAKYKNDLFLEWLPSKDEKSGLLNCIPTLNTELLKKKLLGGKNYAIEYEIKSNKRSKILKVNFSGSENTSVFVRVTDYTKEKEQSYILDSYVKMAEDNRLKLEHSLEVIKNQKEELQAAYTELERERNNIELRALQAVINPHFVSNCLASIQRFIVDNDTELSVNYLANFGSLMRLNFEQSYSDYVPIEEVLKILETYVSIEKIRIDHFWEFELKVDDQLDVTNLKIPPLLIQPFLENAIWHGINRKKEDGKITIRLDLVDKMTLKCVVEDNGVGRHSNSDNKEIKKATLHSLNVTGKRLDILWAEFDRKKEISYTDLKTTDGNPGGTRVQLFIPLDF